MTNSLPVATGRYLSEFSAATRLWNVCDSFKLVNYSPVVTNKGPNQGKEVPAIIARCTHEAEAEKIVNALNTYIHIQEEG